jgi:hypothetical protein
MDQPSNSLAELLNKHAAMLDFMFSLRSPDSGDTRTWTLEEQDALACTIHVRNPRGVIIRMRYHPEHQFISSALEVPNGAPQRPNAPVELWLRLLDGKFPDREKGPLDSRRVASELDVIRRLYTRITLSGFNEVNAIHLVLGYLAGYHDHAAGVRFVPELDQGG